MWQEMFLHSATAQNGGLQRQTCLASPKLSPKREGSDMDFGDFNAGEPPANGGSEPKLNRDAVRYALQDRAEELFRLVWGEPEKAGARDWRARESSARSMAMRGRKRGQWFDHKAGTGGDLFDLLAVELCGLGSAQEDFPRVLQEAARFCGMAEGQSIDIEALTARKAAQRAEEAQQEEADAKRKAALVKALQARSEPLTGSPAAAYLKARGIEALPERWSYLPPVPGLGVPHPEKPALVAWAIDADGTVTGGHRILINEDGSKAEVKFRRLGFGSIGGSPARIAAQAEGGPLCIAEGPETAAAIAQATGFEVWAVFGAGQFAAAPAPLDRQVILCPDRDATDSPAAEAFNRACDELRGQGVNLWVARAPEPEGSKRDLADTLQERGAEAVRDAIAGAKPYARDSKGRFTGSGALPAEPLPMPDFVSPEEAKERIRAEVQTFLERAAQWHAAKAQMKSFDAAFERFEKGQRKTEPAPIDDSIIETAMQPAPVLAIVISPGAGKSRMAREVLAEFDLSAFGGGDVLFTAPTLKLAEEAAQHAQELQAGWHVTRGRSASQPGSGLPMCQRAEEAERVAKAGQRVGPSICERKNGDEDELVLCPHHASCAYIHQWAELRERPELRFEASAYLTLDGDGSGRKTGLQVVDESIWRMFTRKADLTSDAWLRPRKVTPKTKGKAAPTPAERHQADALAADMQKAAEDVLRALQAGQSLAGLSYTAADFRAYAGAERGPDVLAIYPNASDEEIRAALDEREAGDLDAGKRAQVWAILAECLEKGLTDTQRLRVARGVPAPRSGDKRDVLRATWFVEPPRDVPTLLLDADATPEIVERMFPGAELVQVDLRPNAEVVQVTDKTFSATALKNPKLRKEAVELVRAEVLADTMQGARGVLVVATKKVVRQFFEDAGHIFEGMTPSEISQFMQNTELHGARWLWFGPAALGLNTWQGFGTAIVFGREELPVDALEDLLRAIQGDTGAELRLVPEDAQGNKRLPRESVPYLMADGSGAAAKVTAHPDTMGRALQIQTRELATRQTFERLRLATATERKRVILACSVPIPNLPVDKLVTWGELRPTRFEAALAEAAQRGGVLRLSAAGLAEDARQTFPTPKAAARWLESSEGKEAVNTPAPLIRYNTSGAGVFNLRRVSLRLHGRKGRATPALVVLPGDARAMAERQFGPLSMFEEQTGPVPKMSKNPPPEPEEAVVASYKKVPDPAELDFARAHKRAKVAEPKREAVRQEVQIARRSAAAQVARAIAGGATRPKEILTETGLLPEKAGTALRRMQEAGLVYQYRPGRFGLTFDLAELERLQGPEQTHLVIGPGNAVPEVRPAPDRCFVVLPPAEQLQTWLMTHRHSLDGGRRYAVA